ncbi:MAG: hypothetical protein JWM46_487 [Candidatus Kaiserbacteria bacterium]|nr:hypothetical protein [Candidatus Kaiserbacteria bacterium]
MKDMFQSALAYAESVELIRYLGIGSINAGVYFLLFSTLVFFKVHYKVAMVIAFGIGICVAFPLHKYWTFRNMQEETMHFQMLLFTIKKLLFFGANYWLMARIVERYGKKPIPAQIAIGTIGGGASYLATKLIFIF